MSDFKQAIEWMKEGKKVIKKSHNMILDSSGTSMDEVKGPMGKSLDYDDFLATDWEIYCEEHDWMIGKFNSVGEIYHTNFADSVEYCKNCGIEKPLLSDYPRNKELWNKEEENSMNRFGYKFKERYGKEIIFEKEVTKESLSDKRKEIAQEINQSQWGYSEKDVGEKVQNAQKRLNEEFENVEKEYKDNGNKYCIKHVISKIFKEEFGEDLL